jgi:hypothetical protein
LEARRQLNCIRGVIGMSGIDMFANERRIGYVSHP